MFSISRTRFSKIVRRFVFIVSIVSMCAHTQCTLTRTQHRRHSLPSTLKGHDLRKVIDTSMASQHCGWAMTITLITPAQSSTIKGTTKHRRQNICHEVFDIVTLLVCSLNLFHQPRCLCDFLFTCASTCLILYFNFSFSSCSSLQGKSPYSRCFFLLVASTRKVSSSEVLSLFSVFLNLRSLCQSILSIER